MGIQYVGILVGNHMFKGIPRGKTSHENIRFYEEGGRKYGIKPCYFRINDIKPGSNVVTAYVKGNSGYTLKKIPLPKVIHNRTTHKKQSAYIMNLLKKKGIIVFNGYSTKVGKMNNHKILVKHPTIRKHLPHTAAGTTASLRRMMHKYPSLLIKPVKGSLGIGIRKLERVGTKWKLNMSRNRSSIFHKQIPSKLNNILKSGSYFIQQRIPLATYNGKPFDIRVSVQKNRTGRWAVTGMVAKVAASGHYLSNVHQGGKVYPLDTLLRKSSGLNAHMVKRRIRSLSLSVARQLNRYNTNLADLGLDVGITKNGFPYFIESNRRELRYSFREGGLIQVWKATYLNPMGYAKYLLSKKRN